MDLLKDYLASQNKSPVSKILFFIFLMLLLANLGYFQWKNKDSAMPELSGPKGLKAKKILADLNSLDQILPLNMRLDSLTMTPNEIILSGISRSEKSIAYFEKQFSTLNGWHLNENLTQVVAEGVNFKMSFYEKN